jgi:TrmH family RNA methyltransferase
MQTNSVLYFKENNYQIDRTCKPPIIIAWKLRTPENYGNLLRIADNLGCLKVVFVSEERPLSERKIKKTAGESYNRVPFFMVDEDKWLETIPEAYSIIGLETSEKSKNIYRSMLPKSLALMVGNEKHGIETGALIKCAEVMHIPLTGKCTSLNVTHAASIALFEWFRQQHFAT